MKIAVLGVLPSSLYNFRGELIKSLAGKANITALASGADATEIAVIQGLGCEYIDYPVARNGVNPSQDFKTFVSLTRIFKRERPDLLIAYTIKPVIWGGLAARVSKVKAFYPMITGLGYAFQEGGVRKQVLNKLVKALYRFSLIKANKVIFQNKDDLAVFVDNKLVSKEKCVLVNGSGVDLSHYERAPLSDKPVFLLIARLLGAKGIREYISAAEQVKSLYPNAEFHLVGPEDPSPDGISVSDIAPFHDKGIIHYHGAAKDVRPFIKGASIFVLPSYQEGMPRTVLEAMAMARPILTTDVPGCRETVINGRNGWLVPKADSAELANKMVWFIEHPETWQTMADYSYELAMTKFDVHNVNADIIRFIGLDNEKGI